MQKQIDTEGLEIILGGLSSVARDDDSKSRTSETKLTVALKRPGYQTSYVNVVISTNIKTGISSLTSMKHEHKSHFSNEINTKYVSAGALKKRNSESKARINQKVKDAELKIYEEDRVPMTIEQAVNSLDSLLGNG
jgi:hypothetical protein